MCLQIIYFQFSMLRRHIYLFNTLHSSYSKHRVRFCTQVSCWIRGLTFRQSKRANHFVRNSFVVITLPLLPPLCFHVCLHNLVEHFPWPITIRKGWKIPHWPPRDGVCRKQEWEANWNDFNVYYYCSDCSVCNNIMLLLLFYFSFFLFFFLLWKSPFFC